MPKENDISDAIKWAESLAARTLGGDINKHCKTLVEVAKQYVADNKVCEFCDGGPGNNCACACGLAARSV